jgi:hypothetical protein
LNLLSFAEQVDVTWITTPLCAHKVNNLCSDPCHSSPEIPRRLIFIAGDVMNEQDIPIGLRLEAIDLVETEQPKGKLLDKKLRLVAADDHPGVLQQLVSLLEPNSLWSPWQGMVRKPSISSDSTDLMLWCSILKCLS